MGNKGREMVIWNHLMRGKQEQMQRQYDVNIDEEYKEEKQDQSRSYDLEKNGYDNGIVLKRKRVGIFKFQVIVLLFICMGTLFRYGEIFLYGYWENGIFGYNKVQESFEITVEELPGGDPVYVQSLLTYSFGDSWGMPAKLKFKPLSQPGYNRIILSLSTNVTGQQYDRVAHIFLDNVTVWRTSTMESDDKRTMVSKSSKDITQYMSLFEKDRDVELTFQLDNMVNKKQSGIFNVDLKLYYYDSSTEPNDDLETPEGFFRHYATAVPSKVIPLVNDVKKRTPLLYYPIASQSNPRWSRPLTEFVESNVFNRVVLEVFASGNAAEEYWFGNVLDQYASKFKNALREVMGHGPLRVMHVYLSDGENEYFISSVIPTPIIFAGGISPSLWKPCVGIDTFDMESFLIDLTPFLSLLENDEKSWELQLEIVSTESKSYKKTIGENWIISGNILQWANPDIQLEHTGIIKNEHNSTFDVFVDDTEHGSLYQTVNTTIKNSVVSKISYNEKTYYLASDVENEFLSNVTFVDDGNMEHLLVVLNKNKKISLYEPESYKNSLLPIISLIESSHWDLLSDMEVLDVDLPKSELTYSAKLARSVDRLKYINNNTNSEQLPCTTTESLLGYPDGGDDSSSLMIINSLQGFQKGFATYTLSPSGNHGTGDTIHHVEVRKDTPHKEHYKRDVVVVKNEIKADVIQRG